MTNIVSRIKNCIVPDERKYRYIKFGLCRGIHLPLNLRHDFRASIGFYEMELYGYLKDYARPGMCCYDIGASVGYYTFALARLCDSGKIYSVEENKSRFELLRETLTKNQLSSEVIPRNKCVGSTVDHIRNLTTLDHLVFEEGCTPPGLIKMDIEGAEYDANLGADKVLRAYFPNVIAEVHSDELREKCKVLLEEKGYLVKAVHQFAFLPSRGKVYNGWLCARKKERKDQFEKC